MTADWKAIARVVLSGGDVDDPYVDMLGKWARDRAGQPPRVEDASPKSAEDIAAEKAAEERAAREAEAKREKAEEDARFKKLSEDSAVFGRALEAFVAGFNVGQRR